jgi:hypothetical protein
LVSASQERKIRRRNADRRSAYSAVPYGHGRASNDVATRVAEDIPGEQPYPRGVDLPIFREEFEKLYARAEGDASHDKAVHALKATRHVVLALCHKRTWNGFHSSNSSARISSANGTSIPSVLAVCKLTSNSTFVDCSTGRSAGLLPLMMRST